MAFCPNCGTQVADGTAFCGNCGNPMNVAPQAPQAAQAPQAYQTPGYNPYAAPVAVAKPKIAGRGMGISSLVLGIIGLIYSLYMVSATSLYNAATDAIGAFGDIVEEAYDDTIMTTILIWSVLSILATCFGGAAIKKGYKNGVSKAGLILGIIGLVFYLIAIANCA